MVAYLAVAFLTSGLADRIAAGASPRARRLLSGAPMALGLLAAVIAAGLAMEGLATLGD